jgi:ribosomal protein L3 glutamine methyltransferase
MTLAELIESGTRQFEDAGIAFGQGTANARDEASWLVLWALGLPLDTPMEGPGSHAHNAVPAALAKRATELLEKRIFTRKPAAYLTGEAWLHGVSFFVDERVIIPRSLISELLMDGSLDYWLSEETHSALDLCTGNGSLAILAAMAYPQVVIDALDVSTGALEVAQINVDRYSLQERITLHCSDGLSAVRGRRYDLMICNPPYVNAKSLRCLPPEFQAEPALSLDGNRAGGSDGMDFVRALLRDAGQCMQPEGVLVLEIGNERSHFEAAFPRLEALWLETSAGSDQVLLLSRDSLLS